ncbi:DUF4900 domain-containing protein [Gracilimonas sp. BCB1]|uniref:DUF4900 domain-containing protein n=1 Tax=Gracilimonas sp. BCB1 TaxID=3152362 RepID=UPI0032D8D079
MGRSMLILVAGFMIIAGVITNSNNRRAMMLPQKSAQNISEAQAKNSAVSMIKMGIEKITIDNEWDGEISDVSSLPGSASLELYDSQSSSYPEGISVGQGGWDEYKVLLYSEATYGNYTAVVEVMMRRDSYSKYSYFSDEERSSLLGNSEIYFYSSDVISGPIHTNGTFRMSGTPTFYGHVSSPNNWQSRNLFGDNPDFRSTTDFNSPERPLPTQTQINDLKSAANSTGLTFTNQIDVTFQDDGSVSISEYDEAAEVWLPAQEYAAPEHNGIISTTKKASVKGTVAGPLTLHSEDDIEIMGDLEYYDDPRNNEVSADLLGLVSEKDVILDKDAHTYKGSADVNLHASIMAMGTSFRVENYSSGGYRGKINLLGGIIQKNRGPVGTFGGFFGDTGFSKNYEYDTRLRYSIPPYFPRESVFSILSWKDRVIVKN